MPAADECPAAVSDCKLHIGSLLGLLSPLLQVQAVSIARTMLGLPLVNIAGIDIVDGHPKLVLSILWQLMRAHMRRLLQASTFLRACEKCKCTLLCIGCVDGHLKLVLSILWQFMRAHMLLQATPSLCMHAHACVQCSSTSPGVHCCN